MKMIEDFYKYGCKVRLNNSISTIKFNYYFITGVTIA